MRRALMIVALAITVALIAVMWPIVGPVRKSAAAISIGRVHAGYQPTTGKFFVLVIGNDARHGNPNGALADAIHLVGIDPRSMKAGILNFPRGLVGHDPRSRNGQDQRIVDRRGTGACRADGGIANRNPHRVLGDDWVWRLLPDREEPRRSKGRRAAALSTTRAVPEPSCPRAFTSSRRCKPFPSSEIATTFPTETSRAPPIRRGSYSRFCASFVMRSRATLPRS